MKIVFIYFTTSAWLSRVDFRWIKLLVTWFHSWPLIKVRGVHRSLLLLMGVMSDKFWTWIVLWWRLKRKSLWEKGSPSWLQLWKTIFSQNTHTLQKVCTCTWDIEISKAIEFWGVLGLQWRHRLNSCKTNQLFFCFVFNQSSFLMLKQMGDQFESNEITC